MAGKKATKKAAPKRKRATNIGSLTGASLGPSGDTRCARAITAACKKRTITLRAFAELVGVPEQSLRAVRTGRGVMGLRNARIIAKSLEDLTWVANALRDYADAQGVEANIKVSKVR